MFTPIISIVGQYELKIEENNFNSENKILTHHAGKSLHQPPSYMSLRQKLENKVFYI